MSREKQLLRTQYNSARLALDAQYMQEASSQFASHLDAYIQTSGDVIGGYAAIRGEIDVLPAMGALAKRGHLLCLAVVNSTASPLVFRHWQPGGPLEKGMYNIPVPPEGTAELSPDVIIVPMLAFDRRGHRLGYGAGYYDRTVRELRAKKNIVVIGAAYSVQQVDSLPTDEHDEPLDAVITEKGVTSFP